MSYEFLILVPNSKSQASPAIILSSVFSLRLSAEEGAVENGHQVCVMNVAKH